MLLVIKIIIPVISLAAISDGTVCQNYHNYFIIGSEYFVFDYKYSTTFQKGGNYKDHFSRSVITKIYDYKKKLIKTFGKNENIKLSVQEWLQISNIDLMDYNYATKLSDNASNIYNITHPIFRLTGVEIILKITCNNLIRLTQENYGTTICEIVPEINEGWASKGSKITYLEYPDLNEEYIKSVYSDRYRYGIKFKFYITGKIGKYSFTNMANTLISGIVLFGTGTTIIILII